MRVLTWNLWWRFGPWEQRQRPIVAELKRVDSDILMLQEVWAADGEDQVDQLASALGFYSERTRSPDGKPQSFGNAILSRWPVELTETIYLPGADGQPSRRTAMMCHIQAPLGPVGAVVTHLTWEYNYSEVRERQLEAIVDLVGRHRSDDPLSPPVIMAGDLNATPDSTEIARLTGRAKPYDRELVFTDSWAAASDDPGYTWVRDNPYRADSQWPRRRLDYVMVSWPRPKPLGNPISAELVGTEPFEGFVPSDHYGVLAELDDRLHVEGPRRE